MTVFHILAYASLLVLGAGVIARILRLASMPLHLRWELYPVPHERGRAGYGGSRLEEVNWWTKSHRADHVTELRTMLMEILLLKGVWEHNRPLWLSTFTLHFGLYLLIGEAALLVLGGLLILTGGALPQALGAVILALAWAGYLMGLAGSVLMLGRRLFDPKLRAFNSSGHLFNLLLLGAIHATGLLWIAGDPLYISRLTGFLAGLAAPAGPFNLPMLGYWHVGLVLFFFVYFPFTHMTHAFVKYFTYHNVRWEDEPNLPGSRLQEKIVRLESQAPTWAAPHIGADGKKTWVDIVTKTGEEKS
ncbi:MAG: hypothetical protein C4524_14440 [Candidatus Zixiibacteriota bacterium]|nr:MAG: hypothetical protein C4524_14440 [candidate division Zixibacteria bacterium]